MPSAGFGGAVLSLTEDRHMLKWKGAGCDGVSHSDQSTGAIGFDWFSAWYWWRAVVDQQAT